MSIEQEKIPQTELGVDRAYQNLLTDILQHGHDVMDRTGTGTRKVTGRMLKINLAEGFPLLTTKRVWSKGITEELLWFIRGERNIQTLVQAGVHIWDEWPFQKYLEAHEQVENYPKYSDSWKNEMDKFVNKVASDSDFAEQWGDLGPVYGYQWRHWQKRSGGEIDQLAKAIHTIKTRPQDRRIIVSAWNPEDVDNCALPPCHYAFQLDVTENRLNCMMIQRSVDTFLGLPFNIASYALLTNIIAKITNLEPGELTIFLGNTHLYLNHLEQARVQLTRDPRPLPHLELSENIQDINNLSSQDIKIVGYNPHPKIEAPISV